MRTRRQNEFRFKGLTTGQFAEATCQSPQQVRELINEGWFKVQQDGVPECLDVSLPSTKQPSYRIHENAVARYYKERGTTGRKGEAA